VGSGWVESRRWRKPFGVVLIGGRMRGCGGGSAQHELRPTAVRLPGGRGSCRAAGRWCFVSELVLGGPGRWAQVGLSRGVGVSRWVWC
jgi:hypothetical protein